MKQKKQTSTVQTGQTHRAPALSAVGCRLSAVHAPILPTTIRSKAEREATAWLESFNPLRGLSIRRAQMLFDAARRGNDARLQWLYENIEQSDPTLMICAERRASALVDLDWIIRPKAATRVRGFDEGLAREQCALLEAAYGQAEEANLFPAIEHLSKAFFRGHAHVRPIYTPGGTSLSGFECLNSWNLCRDLVTGQWYWNPKASDTLDFSSLQAVPQGELCTLVRSRHIDYPAMAIYLRNGLGERAWGRFLERYGIPPVIITMPQDVDPAQVDTYCERAAKVADGGSGALPFGSTVSYATEARGTNPFKEFLEHQQQLVVLMATGGMLTSLTGATGIGQGATQAHEETWRTIVRRDAVTIATLLNRTVTDALLDRAFPGRPHLAQFDFETEPKPSAGEVFDLAAKAVQAGYQVDKAELEERTGYRLEPAAQPQPFSFNKARPVASRLREAPQPVLNAAVPGGTGEPFTIHRSPFTAKQRELSALASALQADLSPAAQAVQALLDNPSPEAARALIERLPALLPDDPEMAAILEEELAEAFGDEAAKEATVSNSADECQAKDPANCPYHGTGKYADGGSAHAPKEPANPAPKELPPKPNAKAPAAEYRKANLARGEVALGNILSDHADIPAAMVSRKLGPIDFVWGREGTQAQNYSDGYGFSKIIKKHGIEAARKVPEILAYGKYYADEQETGAYAVIYNNWMVTIKKRSSNFYVVTSYETKEKATRYRSRGGQIENKAEDDIGATY